MNSVIQPASHPPTEEQRYDIQRSGCTACAVCVAYHRGDGLVHHLAAVRLEGLEVRRAFVRRLAQHEAALRRGSADDQPLIIMPARDEDTRTLDLSARKGLMESNPMYGLRENKTKLIRGCVSDKAKRISICATYLSVMQ